MRLLYTKEKDDGVALVDRFTAPPSNDTDDTEASEYLTCFNWTLVPFSPKL